MGFVKKYSEPRWPILKPAMYLLRLLQFPTGSCESSERSFHGCGGHFQLGNSFTTFRAYGVEPRCSRRISGLRPPGSFGSRSAVPCREQSSSDGFPGTRWLYRVSRHWFPFLSFRRYFNYESRYFFTFTSREHNYIRKIKMQMLSCNLFLSLDNIMMLSAYKTLTMNVARKMSKEKNFFFSKQTIWKYRTREMKAFHLSMQCDISTFKFVPFFTRKKYR